MPSALRDLDLVIEGMKWFQQEVLGGNEAYKYCRVCNKRIPRVTRLWRKKCRQCGHRTCTEHMEPGRVCRTCVVDGPPGSVKALSTRVEAKLAQLKKMHEQGLLDTATYEQGQRDLVATFTREDDSSAT
jgi:hypothetical protein